ncbi:hypothetical protein RRG08_010922, partial [Elysia crispata]
MAGIDEQDSSSLLKGSVKLKVDSLAK